MTKIPNPLGGRSIDEWIGKTPDAKIPEKVKDRIWVRCGGRCHLSGAKLVKGRDDIEWDHIKPLWAGGEHRETNIAPARKESHKEKSAEDHSAMSKADRIRRKANGTWPKPVGNGRLQSRPFPKSRPV